MTANTVKLERPMNNLTIVTIGNYELAFSYETIIAFYAPSYGWQKSENVWSQTTGRHLNSLPGHTVDYDDFTTRLAITLDEITHHLRPVGEDGQGPTEHYCGDVNNEGKR